MKKILSVALLLMCFFTLSCRAQFSFRRTDGTVGVYPYISLLQSNDVVLIGTPGRSLKTNYNMPLSALLNWLNTNLPASDAPTKANTNSPTIWTPSIIGLQLPQPAGSTDYFAATDTNSAKIFWLDQDGIVNATSVAVDLLSAVTASIPRLSAGGAAGRGITLTIPSNGTSDYIAAFDEGSGKVFYLDQAGVLHANGAGITGDDAPYDANTWNGDTTLPTKNAVRDKIESLVLGAASQTPYVSDHDANLKAITNVGFILQANAGIRQVVKRAAANTVSHTYDALQFHYGNLTTNAYWTVTVGCLTNSNGTQAGDYDSLMTWGFNSPSSTNYNGNLPSLVWVWEDNYISAGIRQAEHYLVWQINSNSPSVRPEGYSLRYDGSILKTFDVGAFNLNTSNALVGISIYKAESNALSLNLKEHSYLSFAGNTRPDGTIIVGTNGGSLLSYGQESIQKFGAFAGTTAKAIMLGGNLNSANGYWFMGEGNNLTGLRWNNTSNRLEYCATAGLSSLATITNNSAWRPFNDFSDGKKSFYQAWVLSATTGDTRELGVYTNSTFQGNGLIRVDVTSANNAGTLHFEVPFNKPDCQSTATWREVLPDNNASDTTTLRVALDFIGMALDSCKLRIRQVGSQAETLRINIEVVGDSANQWINTAVTGSSGTVSGNFRHSAISTRLGNVGIGTKNPTTTLDIVGTLHASGAATLDSTVTLSGGTANSVYGTDGGKNLIAYAASTGITISGGAISVNGQQVTNLDGTTPNLFNGNSLTVGTANIGSATGNGRGLTNFNGANVLYGTNAGSTALFPVGKGGIYSAIITNGNITFTGCSGIDVNGTNVQWGVMYISNTTASAASITVPASWGPTTSVNYTGQIRLAVEYYPQMGSNWTYKYR